MAENKNPAAQNPKAGGAPANPTPPATTTTPPASGAGQAPTQRAGAQLSEAAINAPGANLAEYGRVFGCKPEAIPDNLVISRADGVAVLRDGTKATAASMKAAIEAAEKAEAAADAKPAKK